MGTEEPEAAVAAPAAAPEQPKKKDPWPAPKELERWLMMSSKDTDPGAGFLRRMLLINPAYGAYLTSSEELAELVMSFAKKFRSKLQSCSSPVKPAELYEPICEVVWKVIGHIMHTIIELQDNQHLPVPQMALGQIKMLLQTNEELSRQLKENRRAYLKELALLRDKDRRLSAKAANAIQSLSDEPVYFYEPLSYVLDEHTKDFVKEVIEERMKLEMRSEPAPEEVDEGARLREMQEMENELRKVRGELKAARTEASRNEMAAGRAEEMAAKLKAELAKLKEEQVVTKQEYVEARSEIGDLKAMIEDLNNRIRKTQSELNVAAKGAQGGDAVLTELKELQSQYDDVLEQLRRLKEQMAQMEADKKEQDRKMQEMKDNLSAASDAAARNASQPKEVVEKAGATVTKVVKDDSGMENLTRQHEEIEKKLRETIRKLEEALDEERLKKGPSATTVVHVPSEVVEGGKKKKGGLTEADLKDAVRKAQDALKEKLNEMKEEMDRLKAELEACQQELAQMKKDAKKGAKNDGNLEDELMKAKQWQYKYEELLKLYEAAQAKIMDLEDKINLLIDKLRHYGGDAAVAATLAEIGLEAPTRKREKKKKAWERLYDDAVRRMGEKRARAEKERLQEEAYIARLKAVVALARSRSMAKQVEALAILQKAKAECEARYHDALDGFHERHRDVLEGEFVEVVDFGGGVGGVRCDRCGHTMRFGPHDGARNTDSTKELWMTRSLSTRQEEASADGSPEKRLSQSSGMDGLTPLQSRRLKPSASEASPLQSTLRTTRQEPIDPEMSIMHVRGHSPTRSRSPGQGADGVGGAPAGAGAGWHPVSGFGPLSGNASPDASSLHPHNFHLDTAPTSGSPSGGAQQVLMTRSLKNVASTTSLGGSLPAAPSKRSMSSTWNAGANAENRGQNRSTSPGILSGGGSVPGRDASPPPLRSNNGVGVPAGHGGQQMPWRQPDESASEPRMHVAAPTLDSSLPWKRQARPPPPPPATRGSPSPGPSPTSGFGGRAPGPDWVPVPGRVPSTGALDPLQSNSRFGMPAGTPAGDQPASREGMRSTVSGGKPASRSPRNRQPPHSSSAGGDQEDGQRGSAHGAGVAKAGSSLSMARSMPVLRKDGAVPLMSVNMSSTSGSFGSRPDIGSIPKTPLRSKQRLPDRDGRPIAGHDIPGQKFLVTPLASQQSMAAGVPVKVVIPP